MRTSALCVAVLAALCGPALPVAAQEEPGQCPGTYTGRDHPACPPAKTLGWIDCPARWSEDSISKPLRLTQLYYNYNKAWPYIERDNLDRHPEGAQLYCDYSTDADHGRYKKFIDVPGPMIQWGWHRTPRGRVSGVRVPLAVAARPPVVYIIEPIGERTTLNGFRLGMSRGEVGEAAAAGYAVALADGGAMTLERAGTTLTITFDAAGHSSKITRPVTNRTFKDVHRELVLRFGFGFLIETVAAPPQGSPEGENTSWYSRDKTIAVQAWISSRPGYVDSISLVRRTKN
jgi:hypothetical protein